MEELIGIDSELLLWVNGMHTDTIDPMMRMVSGKTIWMALYVSIACVIWWKYGWRRALLLVAGAGIAVGLSDLVCASVIRPMVERLRPSNLDNPLSQMVHIVDGYRSGRYGFPSCHAANTVALALYTTLVIRKRGYTVAIWLWVALQCYSRMYLGVHYPGDLLVGALIGVLFAVAVYTLTDRIIDLKYDTNLRAKAWPVIAVLAVLLACIIGKGMVDRIESIDNVETVGVIEN